MEPSLAVLDQLINEVAALDVKPSASAIKEPVNKGNLPVSQSFLHHGTFLKHDMEIIENMLKITKQFLNNPPNNFRTLLINLGQLAFNIKHDERDPNCIRNKFADYSGLKGKSREDRHCVHGIPFEGLFYIGKWFEKDKDICRNSDAWAAFYQKEFVLLNQKLVTLSQGQLDKNVLEDIQQLSECANDLLHLEIVINTLEAFNVELNLEDPISRYAIARIYSILGEAAKCLSNTFHDADCLKIIFKKFGKCRDLVKLPFVMPKTAQRMKEAQKFLLSYKLDLEYFFTVVRRAIYDELKKNELGFICKYRTFLKSEIAEAIKCFPEIDNAETEVQEVILNFRAARNVERNITPASAIESDDESEPISDTESNDESDNKDEKDVVEKIKIEGIESAVNLIKGYQKTSVLCEEAKTEYDAVEKKDDSVLLKQQKDHVKILKKKLDIALKNKNRSFEKYDELRKILVENYPKLPNPNHTELMACDTKVFPIEPKANAKKPKIPQSKLLVRYLSSVEDVYKHIHTIDPNASPVVRFAFDQCVSFLGQLFREIEATHKLVLHEPTFSVWNQDFSQTIKIRNQKLMHNVVNYDAQEVTRFVNESVLPWYNNFKAFSCIATHHHIAENYKDDYSKNLKEISILYYDKLGFFYATLHQWHNAERYLTDAYEACKNQVDDRPACIMYNLADVYRVQDNWEKAQYCIQLSWKHRKQYSLKTNKHYIPTLIYLGMCFERLVKVEEALACYNDALKICEEYNLDQKQILHSLANFYANQMDYPSAYLNYKKLLPISENENKIHYLYLLHSLAQTAIQCGQNKEALQHDQKMKKLFQENQSYFKSRLNYDYVKFQEKMIDPIYILDLMGKSQEALILLNKSVLISNEDKILKLRLLRNLGKYQEVKELATALLREKQANEASNKEYVFNCKTCYGQALIHLGDSESGVTILEEMCNEAIVLKKQQGNRIVQMLLPPFNSICIYWMKQGKHDNAKIYIQKALSLLQDAKFLHLSEDVFIILVNFYRIHLIANDIEAINVKMSVYEPLILQYLKQSHPTKSCGSIDELISLLIKAKCFNTASKFLSGLTTNHESSHHNLLEHYVHLSNCLTELGKINDSIIILENYLETYCKKSDKPVCSFVLAVFLHNGNKLESLCRLFDKYQACWNDRLLSSIPPYKIFQTAHNLSHACFKYKVDEKQRDEAVKYAHFYISLLPKIYMLLSEQNPPNVLQAQRELFCQYSKMSMAIAKLQCYEKDVYDSVSKKFFNIITAQVPQKTVLKKYAEKINILYFSNELGVSNSTDNPKMVTINIPNNWQEFLLKFPGSFVPITQVQSNDEEIEDEGARERIKAARQEGQLLAEVVGINLRTLPALTNLSSFLNASTSAPLASSQASHPFVSSHHN